jgi:integrase
VQLSKKLDAFELAKMVGHKDLRMTLNVYYKADAAAIADKLK